MSAIPDSDRAAAFRTAIDAAPSPRNRAKAMIEFCTYLDTDNRSEEALKLAREAAAVADDAVDARLVGWALFRQMMALRNLGRLEEVVALGEETRDQFKYSGDLIGEARAASLLASVFLALGRHDEGMQSLIDSSAMISRTHVADIEFVNTLHLQAQAFQHLNAFEPAVKASERALVFADKLDDPFESVWARYHLADHLVVWADCLTRVEETQAHDLRVRALKLLDEGLESGKTCADEGVLGLLELTRGLALLGLGRVHEGLECLSLASGGCGFGHGAAEQARLDRALGRGFLKIGDLDAALKHLTESVRNLALTDLFGWLSGTLRDRAEVRRGLGDLQGAVVDLDRALDIAERRRVAEAVDRSKGVVGRIDLELRNVDVSRRELHVEVLERMAMVDPLTGVSNRRALDGSGTAAAVSNCGCISVAVVDVDHFKAINDNFGHLTGDAVLKRIATTLDESIRKGVDVVARYAGDEFVLVLLGIDEDAASELCERIRVAITEYSWHELKPDLAVTVSIGVATGTVPNSFWNLFSDADAALFQAKEDGRNRSGVHRLPA